MVNIRMCYVFLMNIYRWMIEILNDAKFFQVGDAHTTWTILTLHNRSEKWA